MTCWLAQFSVVPCDGQLVRAHLISKQRIRRELNERVQRREITKTAMQLIVWDDRAWVPACGGISGLGGHHGALDGRILSVPRSALPDGLEEYAAEHGLVWSLDRDYGALGLAA